MDRLNNYYSYSEETTISLCYTSPNEEIKWKGFLILSFPIVFGKFSLYTVSCVWLCRKFGPIDSPKSCTLNSSHESSGGNILCKGSHCLKRGVGQARVGMFHAVFFFSPESLLSEYSSFSQNPIYHTNNMKKADQAEAFILHWFSV